MGKIEEAIKKINTEIQKQPNIRYLALIGEHIIDCITTEAAAEAVLAEKKTLSGAMQKIQTEAGKQKNGNMAIVEDCIVYGWAREYFGLTGAPTKKQHETAKMQTIAEFPKEKPKKALQRLSLDDF